MYKADPGSKWLECEVLAVLSAADAFLHSESAGASTQELPQGSPCTAAVNL